jgi:hypothetical protein
MSVFTSSDFDVLRIDGGSSKPLSLGPSVTSLSELTDVQINEPVLDGQILKYIASTGKWTNVDPSLISQDYVEGYYSASGNSYTTTFVIPHGFGATPTTVLVDAQSPEANEDYTITYDSVNITLEYSFPPPQGTNNLSFYYRVS